MSSSDEPLDKRADHSSGKGLHTEFGIDRGGDRGGDPTPGGQQSSDTFRMPPQAQPRPGEPETQSPGQDAQDAHGQSGPAPTSKPPTDSAAAIEPDAAASGQEQGKSHDL